MSTKTPSPLPLPTPSRRRTDKSPYTHNQTDEIIRDLCRARTDAVRDLRASRFQLKAFLLRHGYRYGGKTSWTQAHLRYLRELSLPNPAQKVILEEYITATDAANERIARIEDPMRSFLQTWHLRPSVEALMAFRGFQTVAAMVPVSELGEISRFTHPRQLMCYLGLVSSEASSSNKRRQGAITKCGNGHARWILIECAQHYRLPPKVSKDLTKRQEGQSRDVKTLSWKAQNRLFKRFHALNKRGLPVNKTIVAVARELTGFVWALLKDIEPSGAS